MAALSQNHPQDLKERSGAICCVRLRCLRRAAKAFGVSLQRCSWKAAHTRSCAPKVSSALGANSGGAGGKSTSGAVLWPSEALLFRAAWAACAAMPRVRRRSSLTSTALPTRCRSYDLRTPQGSAPKAHRSIISLCMSLPPLGHRPEDVADDAIPEQRHLASSLAAADAELDPHKSLRPARAHPAPDLEKEPEQGERATGPQAMLEVAPSGDKAHGPDGVFDIKSEHARVPGPARANSR